MNLENCVKNPHISWNNWTIFEIPQANFEGKNSSYWRSRPYSQCPNKSPGTFIKIWHFLVTGCPYYVQYFYPILMKIFTVLFIRYSIFAFLRRILYTGFLISSIFQVLGWELGHTTFVITWFVHPSFASIIQLNWYSKKIWFEMQLQTVREFTHLHGGQRLENL